MKKKKSVNRPKKNSGSGGKPGTAAQAETQGKPMQTTISNYYVTMSGTSMATPDIAGAVRPLKKNPIWHPGDVKRHF
ncbi:MAG: S8 family serine peptidase [Eubacteriales bacterium]